MFLFGCGDTKTLITQHTPPGANLIPAVISRAMRHAKKFPPPRPAEKTPPSPRPVTPLGKIPKFFLRRCAPGYPSLIVTLKNLRGRQGWGLNGPVPPRAAPRVIYWSSSINPRSLVAFLQCIPIFALCSGVCLNWFTTLVRLQSGYQETGPDIIRGIILFWCLWIAC